MKLESVLSDMVEIPPTPQIIPKIQAVLRDPDANTGDVVDLLKLDVSLGARILRFANSSYFAGASPANGLDNAIQRIGFREINRLVSIAASKGILGGALPAYNTKKGEMLEVSLCCAQLMHSIGKLAEPETVDTYYTTGLFHSIGKIVIDQYLKKRSLVLYEADAAENGAGEISPEIERRFLGFDHTEAGAAFLQLWKFPPAITEPIRNQIDVQESGEPYRKMTIALHFSRSEATRLSQANTAPSSVDAPPELLDVLGSDEAGLLRCTAEAYDDYQSIKSRIF